MERDRTEQEFLMRDFSEANFTEFTLKPKGIGETGNTGAKIAISGKVLRNQGGDQGSNESYLQPMDWNEPSRGLRKFEDQGNASRS